MPDAIGLYIHIPFCKRRCDYCDFATSVEPEAEWSPYVEAALRELEPWSGRLRRRALHSIYLGGGTPSLIGPQRIGRILDKVRASFRMESPVEITLEANPETLTLESLAALREAGVNRLSLGVQSFQPLLLKRLNRDSSRETVERSVEWARRAGFDNVSFDLIYGIPGQSLREWKSDLEQALGLEPEHLSTYELTLEPATPMGQRVSAGRERLPPEEEVVAMYDHARDVLPEQGYHQYEISNFARPGRECAHNVHTWRQGEYLGVGLAAHSHLDGRRFHNPRAFEAYLTNAASATEDDDRCEWDSEQRWGEALILGLRLTPGVALDELERRIGSALPEALQATLQEFEKQGILERLRGRLRLTRRGQLLSDSLFAELV